MMKFRRSMKSDGSNKHDSAKPVQISIPQKDAIAIEPPKKVIKALYDYTAPTNPPYYLSFSAGDFLHVVGRENDPDWMEACNPLLGTRGLVPVKYFSEIGKTVRDSGDSSKSAGATHDSGYAETGQRQMMQPSGRTSAPDNHNNINSSNNIISSPQPPPIGQSMHRSSQSLSKSAGGVYGIVAYDFHAERPDELDAKAGEAIIVIAQSNPEWFVAKPITRLGGPGLIPVSFIEIRDMTTGQKADDPVAAVSKAGIPRVEDWKRMAAEYKNTSIPLGTVTTREQQASQSMQNSMERLSLMDNNNNNNHHHHHHNGNGQSQQMDQQQYMNGSGHQRTPSGFKYAQQQEQNLFSPVRASVPKFTFADEKFHFVVECKLSNGTHWDLSRIYEDFYELQINLINAFPEEAGQVHGRGRTLPYMPGPVKFVTDKISEGRRANLDEYLRDLLKMPPHVTSSSLVRSFFHYRDGDYEVDPNVVDLNEHARPMAQQHHHHHHHARQSSLNNNMNNNSNNNNNNNNIIMNNNNNTSQTAYAEHAYASPDPQQRAPSSQGMHQYNQSQSNNIYNHQRGQSSMTSVGGFQPSHNRSASQYTLQQQQQQPPQSYPQQQAIGNAPVPVPQVAPHATTAGTAIANTAPVKVKAWFDRDTCVVIRMPPRGQFTFDELYAKISERRRLEFKKPTDETDQLDIEYRDEKDGEYYRLEGDEDLEIAVERNEKLTLAVRAARS